MALGHQVQTLIGISLLGYDYCLSGKTGIIRRVNHLGAHRSPLWVIQRRIVGALEGLLLLPMQKPNRRPHQTGTYFSTLAGGLELDAVLTARVPRERFS